MDLLHTEAKIRHEKGKWHLYSEKGKHLGGPYDTKEEALKRLQAVEYFKKHSDLLEDPSPYFCETCRESISNKDYVSGNYITELAPLSGKDMAVKRFHPGCSGKKASIDTTLNLIAEGTYEFSCLMADINKNLKDEILKWNYANIPEDIIFIKPKDAAIGRELKPHVTVKYGLHTEDPEYIFNEIPKEPIKFKLGKVSKFESNPDYDVLKIDIISEDLDKLSKKISDKFENSDTHKEFKPHLTLAYVAKGKGNELVGNSVFENKEGMFQTFLFTNPNNDEFKKHVGKEASMDDTLNLIAAESETKKWKGLRYDDRTGKWEVYITERVSKDFTNEREAITFLKQASLEVKADNKQENPIVGPGQEELVGVKDINRFKKIKYDKNKDMWVVDITERENSLFDSETDALKALKRKSFVIVEDDAGPESDPEFKAVGTCQECNTQIYPINTQEFRFNRQQAAEAFCPYCGTSVPLTTDSEPAFMYSNSSQDLFIEKIANTYIEVPFLFDISDADILEYLEAVPSSKLAFLKAEKIEDLLFIFKDIAGWLIQAGRMEAKSFDRSKINLQSIDEAQIEKVHRALELIQSVVKKESLNLVAEFDPKQVAMGHEVEKEHVQSLINLIKGITGEKIEDKRLKELLDISIDSITKDHLKELEDYYTRLQKMEADKKAVMQGDLYNSPKLHEEHNKEKSKKLKDRLSGTKSGDEESDYAFWVPEGGYAPAFIEETNPGLGGSGWSQASNYLSLVKTAGQMSELFSKIELWMEDNWTDEREVLIDKALNQDWGISKEEANYDLMNLIYDRLLTKRTSKIRLDPTDQYLGLRLAKFLLSLDESLLKSMRDSLDPQGEFTEEIEKAHKADTAAKLLEACLEMSPEALEEFLNKFDLVFVEEGEGESAVDMIKNLPGLPHSTEKEINYLLDLYNMGEIDKGMLERQLKQLTAEHKGVLHIVAIILHLSDLIKDSQIVSLIETITNEMLKNKYNRETRHAQENLINVYMDEYRGNIQKVLDVHLKNEPKEIIEEHYNALKNYIMRKVLDKVNIAPNYPEKVLSTLDGIAIKIKANAGEIVNIAPDIEKIADAYKFGRCNEFISDAIEYVNIKLGN